MRLERKSAWRGMLTIAATYVAFLLFAQFGFLQQTRQALHDGGQVRAVMAAMGAGGLVASLATAWLLGRFPAVRLVRIGLAAVAVVAAVSIGCQGFASLLTVAAAVGGSLGLLTVAVAASLPEMVPSQAMGLAAGLATGAAYLVSNIPVLFEGAPSLRALFPAGLSLLALAWGPHPPKQAQRQSPVFFPPLPGDGGEMGEGGQGGEVGEALSRLVPIFLVLIWLDSAAFAIVQASPELKARTWGSSGQQILQGVTHLVAAAGAGWLLDAGFGIAVPLAAWCLFAAAFPLLQQGGAGASLAGPLYAVGISFYSTALVVLPSWHSEAAVPPPRWRAGVLYGVAGWIGSALGVGMAQDLGAIPPWFLTATGGALLIAWAWPRRPVLAQLARLAGPAAALGACGVLVVVLASPRPERRDGSAAAVARGRQVYIAEGCIHCHSQYVRPGTRDVAWWGPARPLDRGEKPPLVGARRIGPDLLAVGNRRGELWQEAHLRDPRRLNPGSRMPSYAHLFAGSGERGRDLVAYLASLGADSAVARWTLTEREDTASPAGSAARGARLFASYCAVCHGAAGRGDGPLAASLGDPYVDLRKPWFHALPRGLQGAPATRALARIVRHGLPPTSMPGHEWLTDRQVADLAAFVATLPAPVKEK